MYYIEVLQTWRILRRYLIVLAGLYLLGSVFFGILHHLGSGDAGKTYSVGGHAVIVAFICLLFASISGSSLSRHLDHLDFALTKPRSRNSFVASVLGIDVLSLGVFFIITSLAVTAFHIVVGETHGLVLDAASWFGIAIAFGSVLAWYAIVQAISCVRGAAGWALAGVWVAALGVHVLGAVNIGPGLNALLVALNFINPISNLTIVPSDPTGAASLSLAAHAVTIYIVAAVAAFIALIRWRRVEQ